MRPEDVTLVIPCYNVANTLPQVLSAVERLDPAPARVLLVDDGSTDATKQVAASRDVDLVEHPENKGLGATLNTALEEVDTPGYAKIDADIVVEPDWLGTLCEHIEERDADLVCGRFVEQVTTTGDKWRDKHPSPSFPKSPRYNVTINGANLLARTEALRDIDGWDETYNRSFDDIDLFRRLIISGHPVFYAPDVVATHIRTDTWREALRLAWAYHYDPIAGEENPEKLTELLVRLPRLAFHSGANVFVDVRDGDYDIAWISLLRFFYHVKWDVESVREAASA